MAHYSQNTCHIYIYIYTHTHIHIHTHTHTHTHTHICLYKKGKVVPVTGQVVAQRVGRGIALLFHDHSTRRG